MKVRYVPYEPPAITQEAGDNYRLALTPEVSAGVAAMHSRTDKGLDGILEILMKRGGLENGVETVLGFLDYGHASIAQLAAGISLHMEGVPLYLIHYIFEKTRVGAGQERSTRYGSFSMSGMAEPSDLGIKECDRGRYSDHLKEQLDAYSRATALWQSVAQKHPDLLNIPESADEKVKERFRRNFVFDRARYWIPTCALNNMNLTTNAGEWGEIVRWLWAAPWPCAQELAASIIRELTLAIPRMLKHAKPKPEYLAAWQDEFDSWMGNAKADSWRNLESDFVNVFTHDSDEEVEEIFVHDLRNHTNRYSPIGRTMVCTPIQFGWTHVAEAEIRDMNRHRPGEKNFFRTPMGFYGAKDQLDKVLVRNDGWDIGKECAEHGNELMPLGWKATEECHKKLLNGDASHMWWATLGTQFPYSHTTTVGHFIYILELRTGTGAHFRYADHYRALASRWFKKFPITQQLIKLGNAEPE